MPSMELLLEAEKRGILPADKKPLLDEARKRGLIPGQAVSEQPPTAEDVLSGKAQMPATGLLNPDLNWQARPEQPLMPVPSMNILPSLANLPIDMAKSIGKSFTLGNTREAMRGESPPPGPFFLRNLWPFLNIAQKVGGTAKKATDITAT